MVLYQLYLQIKTHKNKKMKKERKLSLGPKDTFTQGLDIEQAKVANPNQSMPITQKVKMGSGGTKLKG